MKQKLTLEQHREIGTELKRIREYLMHVSILAAKSYGVASKAHRRLDRAYISTDKARSTMDSQCFNDYPADATPQIYYPPNDRS